MISIKSFLKEATIYSLSNFLNKAITIFLLPLYTHYLTPGEFGMFDFILITINLINLTIAFEIHQSIARFYSEWELEERKFYLSSALIFILLVYSGFSIFVYLNKNLFAKIILGDYNHYNIIIYSIGMIWTSGIYYFTQSQLRWQMKSKEFAICTFTFTITTFLASIILVKYNEMGLIGVINGLTIGNIFGIITTLYFTRNSYGLFFSLRRVVSMLKFSSPLVFSSVSLFLLIYIDRIMIKNFLTFKDLGVFGIAYKFSSILSFLSLGINNAILPLIYNNHKDKTTPAQISKILNLYILLSLMLMSIISIFSRELIMIFATFEYLDATKIIPFLILITILSSINNFIPGLFIEKKTKIIAYINIFTALFSLITNYILIKKLGLIGSCYANLLAFSFGLSINYFISQKYYPIDIFFVKILKIFIVSFILVTTNIFLIEYNITFNIFFKILLLFSYIPLCFFIFYSKNTIHNNFELSLKYIFRK